MPEAGAREEPPDAGDRGGATQDADEQPRPQGEGGKDARSAPSQDRFWGQPGHEVAQGCLDLVESDGAAFRNRCRGLGYGLLRAS
ncbi:MAG: hypothetical protein EBS89_11430 [Proteobacteria bacterium]|nr:hypothetical protein [Pseudomonadota bacterium]